MKRRHDERGALMMEMIVAMAITMTVIVPLGYSFIRELRLCHVYYQRAAAMEIVDGEMEVLAAGEWRSFLEGTQPYEVHAKSAVNLPAGRFELTIFGQRLRLEWRPEERRYGAPIVREAMGR